jgi:hypothetical protein
MRDTQDGLTGFYLILPTAGISVTRRAVPCSFTRAESVRSVRTHAGAHVASSTASSDLSERPPKSGTVSFEQPTLFSISGRPRLAIRRFSSRSQLCQATRVPFPMLGKTRFRWRRSFPQRAGRIMRHRSPDSSSIHPHRFSLAEPCCAGHIGNCRIFIGHSECIFRSRARSTFASIELCLSPRDCDYLGTC